MNAAVQRALAGCLAGVLAAATAFAHRGEKHDEPTVETALLAPGYGALAFPAPEPGTYRQPNSGAAADGEVLDTENRTHSLHQLFAGKVVVLAFFYRLCDDVNGCPLTEAVLRQVRRRIAEQPELAGSVRLLSLSFDTRRDTPTALRPLQASVDSVEAPDWKYLTNRGPDELQPIVEA